MTYAFLLYPHANVRYRQSLLQLATQELAMTLTALGARGRGCAQGDGLATFLTFEAAKSPEREQCACSASWPASHALWHGGRQADPRLSAPIPTTSEIHPRCSNTRGKTNEMFTDTMLTMALAASAFMPVHDSQLVVCDPMAGRGTTRMLALRRGYHGVGL